MAKVSTFHELILDAGEALDTALLHDLHDKTSGLSERLLATVALGYAIFGSVVGLVDYRLSGDWVLLATGPVVFVGAALLALVVCLPSLFFYTQLASLDAPFRLVSSQALRVQAQTAMLLLAASPIYAALALAAELCDPNFAVYGNSLSVVGHWLPLVIGLFAVRSLYSSMRRMAEILPEAHRRRPGYLGRLVASWGAIYVSVFPVALHWLEELSLH